MWSFLAPILNSIFAQAFKSYVDLQKAKLDAGNTSENIAATLAAKELTLEQREAELGAQITISEEGRWWTALPRAIVCYSFAIYVAYIVVINKVLGWGTTPPLTGDVEIWGTWVMSMWFGGRSLEKIARIIKR